MVTYLSYAKTLCGLIQSFIGQEGKKDWISYNYSWRGYYDVQNANPLINIKNFDVSDFFEDSNNEIGHLIGGGVISSWDNN